MNRSNNQIKQNDCIFCEDDEPDQLFYMMNEALVVKHTEQQKRPTNYYIDSILKIDDPLNAYEAWAVYQYHQYLVEDQHHQFMKRTYKYQEIINKLKSFQEYYKFHNDVPRVIELGVEKIMEKYYDKKRKLDYKKIKKVLKQEQGMSITSVEDSICETNQEIQKKSKYSTFLGLNDQDELTKVSDSRLLQNMCTQIENNIPFSKDEGQLSIEGSFSSDKYFEEYLVQAQKKERQKNRQIKKIKVENRIVNKLNLKELLQNRKKNDQPMKQINNMKKELKNKFVHKTIINNYQVRNANFYDDGHLFRKKLNINEEVNGTSKFDSNQKVIAEIYKSSQLQLRLKTFSTNNKTKPTSNKSLHQTNPIDKKVSRLKQTDHHKIIDGHSARKNNFNSNNQFKRSMNRVTKSLSTSTLRKRSLSNNNKIGSTSHTLLSKGISERKKLDKISRYNDPIKRQIIEKAFGPNNHYSSKTETKPISSLSTPQQSLPLTHGSLRAPIRTSQHPTRTSQHPTRPSFLLWCQ